MDKNQPNPYESSSSQYTKYPIFSWFFLIFFFLHLKIFFFSIVKLITIINKLNKMKINIFIIVNIIILTKSTKIALKFH
jgi:hypothetical protein